MNRDEELVAEWLRSKGHKVCHGQDPPDLVMDGGIAVEVTTINSLAHRSIWQFLDATFIKSLGPAENGRGYWVSIEYEDETMFQSVDEGKRKKELRKHIKQVLEDHYRNPDSGIWRYEHNPIKLPYGLTLKILGEKTDNPDRCKYEVYIGGESKGDIGVDTLVKNIQAAIDKKSANKRIQERAAKYREWRLVVTDVFSYIDRLNQDSSKVVSDAIVRREPWKHIIAVAVRSNKVCRAVAL